MNVALLGAASHVGGRLAALLRESGWARPVPVRPHDPEATDLLREADAVVDCAPDPRQAAVRRTAWLRACTGPGHSRLVVLGSAQVYGGVEGRIDERTPARGASPGARAWRRVEAAARECAWGGGQVVLLRAGLVWGAGHPGMHRLAQLLLARRLGDLGAHGDGWSNLLATDDACLAIVRALQVPMAPGELRCYNLAAPDSPRWNELFVDLALALGVTPVPRIAGWRVAAARWLEAPLLGAARAMRLAETSPVAAFPHGGPGGWGRQQRIDATAATRDLRLDWTPYPAVLTEATAWEVRQASLARSGWAGVRAPGHPSAAPRT